MGLVVTISFTPSQARHGNLESLYRTTATSCEYFTRPEGQRGRLHAGASRVRNGTIVQNHNQSNPKKAGHMAISITSLYLSYMHTRSSVVWPTPHVTTKRQGSIISLRCKWLRRRATATIQKGPPSPRYCAQPARRHARTAAGTHTRARARAHARV